MNGIGSHTLPNRGASVEWQTPPEIIDQLGPFNDDPCLPGATDGLTRKWHGLVWLNPPYGRDMWPWFHKLADHGNGIGILFARTETIGFRGAVWKRAHAVMFLHGRPHFYRNGERAKGNSGGPVCLVAYGKHAADRLRCSHLVGTYIDKWWAKP